MTILDKALWVRKVTDLFRDYDKPWVRGDFTAVRKATVQEALDAGTCFVWVNASGKPVVGMLTSSAPKDDDVRDSFDRVLGQARKGDLRVHRIACAPGCESQLAACLAELRAPRIWVEFWQESARLRAAARAAGFMYMGARVKVPAGELFGVWAKGVRERGLMTDPLFFAQEATLTRLRLPPRTRLRALVDRARHEVEEASVAWARHYSVYNVGGAWSAIALRGYGDVNFIGKPAEMSVNWKDAHPAWQTMKIGDTPMRAQLPHCNALVDLIPGVKHRIRLMRLAPGKGELLRHSDLTDRQTGVRDGELMRIHFPLVTNPAVLFTMWDLQGRTLRGHMEAGECWYLDSRKPHTAVNGGVHERLHLVLDVEASDALRSMLDVEAPVVSDDTEPPCPLVPHGLQRAA